MNELTEGQSSRTLIEIVKNNAKLAAQIAVTLSGCADSLEEQIEQQTLQGKKTETLAQGRPVTIIGGASIDIITKSETIVDGPGDN